MARPASIRDETLIDAARAVFVQRGVTATVEEVARRAGVSTGTVMKRFGSKHALFNAAMSVEEPMAAITGLLLDTADRAALERLATAALGRLRQVVPMILQGGTARGAAGTHPDLKGPNPKPVQAITFLASLFQREMKAGRMPARDAEVLARVFIGSLWHRAELEHLLGSANPPLDDSRFIRGLVDVIWPEAPKDTIAPQAVARPEGRPANRPAPRPRSGAKKIS
jgi:AcrR family transcriptional regulator